MLALVRKVEQAGCPLAADPIVCEDVFSGAPVVGGFDPARRVVVMNPAVPAAHMTQSEWTRTITHELVHAFDHCRAVLDPRDCRHLACTEVRAANLSGDCDFSADLARGGVFAAGFANAGVRRHQQACVQRRAVTSVALHAQCAHVARDAVNDVYDACYADTAPFPTN